MLPLGAPATFTARGWKGEEVARLRGPAQAQAQAARSFSRAAPAPPASPTVHSMRAQTGRNENMNARPRAAIHAHAWHGSTPLVPVVACVMERTGAMGFMCVRGGGGRVCAVSRRQRCVRARSRRGAACQLQQQLGPEAALLGLGRPDAVALEQLRLHLRPRPKGGDGAALSPAQTAEPSLRAPAYAALAVVAWTTVSGQRGAWCVRGLGDGPCPLWHTRDRSCAAV